jgi:hypothetical protein
VNTAKLPNVLPHGECDAHGIERQNRVLDKYDDRNYIQVRRRLERQATRGANVYWRLDTHWTTVAAAEYAEALAGRLSPTSHHCSPTAPLGRPSRSTLPAWD